MENKKFMTWLDFFRMNKHISDSHKRLYADIKELFLRMYKNKLISKEMVLKFYDEDEIDDVKFDTTIEALDETISRLNQMQKSIEVELKTNKKMQEEINAEYKRRGIEELKNV
jgi:hypothetical protein